MPEIFLAIWLIIVFIALYLTLKHFKLFIKTPATQLEDRKALTEQVMAALHGAKCPLCGEITHVESVTPISEKTYDLSAILTCENEKCNQKSMWKLMNGYWRLIAPFKYTSVKQVPTEIFVPTKEEEIQFVFAE